MAKGAGNVESFPLDVPIGDDVLSLPVPLDGHDDAHGEEDDRQHDDHARDYDDGHRRQSVSNRIARAERECPGNGNTLNKLTFAGSWQPSLNLPGVVLGLVVVAVSLRAECNIDAGHEDVVEAHAVHCVQASVPKRGRGVVQWQGVTDVHVGGAGQLSAASRVHDGTPLNERLARVVVTREYELFGL